jgi:hypothetical protein
LDLRDCVGIEKGKCYRMKYIVVLGENSFTT